MNKVIGLIKDELGGKIMTTFVGLTGKTQSLLIDDNDTEDKKAKCTKKCVIKRKLENYTNCLEATQLENKINHLDKKNQIDIDSFNCCNRKHKEFIKTIN